MRATRKDAPLYDARERAYERRCDATQRVAALRCASAFADYYACRAARCDAVHEAIFADLPYLPAKMRAGAFAMRRNMPMMRGAVSRVPRLPCARACCMRAFMRDIYAAARDESVSAAGDGAACLMRPCLLSAAHLFHLP